MDPRFKLYCDFRDAYLSANPELKTERACKNAQEKWNAVKNNDEEVKNLIRVWREKYASSKSRLLNMWARVSPKIKVDSLSATESLSVPTVLSIKADTASTQAVEMMQPGTNKLSQSNAAGESELCKSFDTTGIKPHAVTGHMLNKSCL